MTFHLSAVFFVVAASAVGSACDSLSHLKIPDAHVTFAVQRAPGSFSIPASTNTANLPAFCRVILKLTPSADSEIHAEVWLPEQWNQRFQGTGNGGFAGSISYGSLVAGVQNGYAVANSDMGMSLPPGETASALSGHRERWIDWGYRATHQMTLAAKLVVAAYYGKLPRRSYFTGCSTGGQQGLMEAQRYPQDYDGIVAGAPANNRTGVHISILSNFIATHRDAGSFLPEGKLKLLGAAVLKSCDGLDGAQDGILNDPRKCNFDPIDLLCSGEDQEGCLTRSQVDSARQVYRGPRNPRTGNDIYPGVPRGSESEWSRFGPEQSKAPSYAPIFEWALGPDWNWKSFNFDSDVDRLSSTLGFLNALDANLEPFHKLGHKLLVYHGWADWLVPPGESINYYDAVHARDKNADSYYRLFMVPGMFHCNGGPGFSNFDALAPLVHWVEDGAAPDFIPSTDKKSAPPSTRPLCVYPKAANAPAFRCEDPVIRP